MTFKKLTPSMVKNINSNIDIMVNLGWPLVSELRKKIAYYTSAAADENVVENLNQFVEHFKQTYISKWEEKAYQDINSISLYDKIFKVYPSMSEVAEYNNEVTFYICLTILLSNIKDKDLEVFPSPLQYIIKQVIEKFSVKEIVKIRDLDIPESVFIDSYWLSDMTGQEVREITQEDINEAKNVYMLKARGNQLIITADATHSFLSKYFIAFNVDNLRVIKDGKLTIYANCDNSKAMLIGSKGRHISWVKVKINDALANLDIKLAHHIKYITVK